MQVRAGELAEVALEAAGAAAGVLAHWYGRTLDVQTKTTATDPVSEADREAERVLVETLTAHRPDDGLLGEEGAARASQTGLRWVIDPLDGTVNFLYGLPAWAVSVAVEREEPDGWRAVGGVVAQPATGEVFSAAAGDGAWLGSFAAPRERRLRVNDPVDLPQALIATGFAYDRTHRRAQAQVAAEVAATARDIRRIGSAALDLCAVAAGRVDAYYENSVQRWDWAAGGVIAAEAGAVVSALGGGLPGQEGVVAAGAGLHDALRALVAP